VIHLGWLHNGGRARISPVLPPELPFAVAQARPDRDNLARIIRA